MLLTTFHSILKKQTPSFDSNCIDDWEEKINAIVEETIGEDMSLISGIPPWVQMYFEKLIEKSGKSIKSYFLTLTCLFMEGLTISLTKKQWKG